jgi:3'-phosphoadenosine 5'-phosphosulfate (PAPS) 3'-phosphatase
MTELKGVELVRDLIAASVTASREAAQIIRDVKISGELNVQEKSEKTDYVTKADIEAQKCIVEHLKHFFPDIKYRGEEGVCRNFFGLV